MVATTGGNNRADQIVTSHAISYGPVSASRVSIAQKMNQIYDKSHVS